MGWNLSAFAGGALFVQTLATVAAAADNPPEVNIVEPPFKPVQSWTYDPQTIEVKVGTTITWHNTGAVVHTVTADDGKTVNSGNIAKDAKFTFTAAAPGTFSYHCKYHLWMKGKIVVTP